MEDGLILKTFDVDYTSHTDKVEVISLSWAAGFDCRAGSCGNCCLTDRPDCAPSTHNVDLDKSICGFYDVRRRICRKYSERPVMCKIYPFFIGFEDGAIRMSASLECPATNSNRQLGGDMVGGIIGEPYVQEVIQLMRSSYKTALSVHPELDTIWRNLQKETRSQLNRVAAFPFVSEVRERIWKTAIDLLRDDRLSQQIPKLGPVPVFELAKGMKGLYTATRFTSRNLASFRLKGSRFVATLYGSDLRETRKLEIKPPWGLIELELETEARSVLTDYVSLLVKRPLLSLAATVTATKNTPVLNNLVGNLTGALAIVDVGATLIARRDGIGSIDRDTMREIISFSESNIHNQFIHLGPSRVIK